MAPTVQQFFTWQCGAPAPPPPPPLPRGGQSPQGEERVPQHRAPIMVEGDRSVRRLSPAAKKRSVNLHLPKSTTPIPSTALPRRSLVELGGSAEGASPPDLAPASFVGVHSKVVKLYSAIHVRQDELCPYWNGKGGANTSLGDVSGNPGDIGCQHGCRCTWGKSCYRHSVHVGEALPINVGGCMLSAPALVAYAILLFLGFLLVIVVGRALLNSFVPPPTKACCDMDAPSAAAGQGSDERRQLQLMAQQLQEQLRKHEQAQRRRNSWGSSGSRGIAGSSGSPSQRSTANVGFMPPQESGSEEEEPTGHGGEDDPCLGSAGRTLRRTPPSVLSPTMSSVSPRRHIGAKLMTEQLFPHPLQEASANAEVEVVRDGREPECDPSHKLNSQPEAA